jgi:hypothetical protein
VVFGIDTRPTGDGRSRMIGRLMSARSQRVPSVSLRPIRLGDADTMTTPLRAIDRGDDAPWRRYPGRLRAGFITCVDVNGTAVWKMQAVSHHKCWTCYPEDVRRTRSVILAGFEQGW